MVSRPGDHSGNDGLDLMAANIMAVRGVHCYSFSKKSSRIRDFSFKASPEYAMPIEPRIKEHKYVISGHPCFEN